VVAATVCNLVISVTRGESGGGNRHAFVIDITRGRIIYLSAASPHGEICLLPVGGDRCNLVISITRSGEWWRRQMRPRYIYNEGGDYLSATSLHGEICLLPLCWTPNPPSKALWQPILFYLPPILFVSSIFVSHIIAIGGLLWLFL
jgi:hypothetical protein